MNCILMSASSIKSTDYLCHFVGILSRGKYDDDEKDLLHDVQLPIFKHSKCDEIYEKKLTHQMICAGYVNSTTNMGPCDGDPGGPLVCRGLLFGITSMTKSNEPCGKYPAIFGRVKSIIKWIREVTGIKP